MENVRFIEKNACHAADRGKKYQIVIDRSVKFLRGGGGGGGDTDTKECLRTSSSFDQITPF